MLDKYKVFPWFTMWSFFPCFKPRCCPIGSCDSFQSWLALQIMSDFDLPTLWLNWALLYIYPYIWNFPTGRIDIYKCPIMMDCFFDAWILSPIHPHTAVPHSRNPCGSQGPLWWNPRRFSWWKDRGWIWECWFYFLACILPQLASQWTQWCTWTCFHESKIQSKK